MITPERDFMRFWIIEFPTLTGAEAWIEAEMASPMAPPYGAYGYYEYWLARRWAVAELNSLVTNPLPPMTPFDDDPHQIPSLDYRQEQHSDLALRTLATGSQYGIHAGTQR